MSEAPERQHDETPGEFLGRALKSASTNPNRLAEKLDGDVSATTIRSYVAGSKSRSPQLRLIASGLGKYGPGVLRAYGEVEAAEDLQIELDEARRREQEPRRAVTIQYRGRDLTEDELAATQIFIETIVARNR